MSNLSDNWLLLYMQNEDYDQNTRGLTNKQVDDLFGSNAVSYISK